MLVVSLYIKQMPSDGDILCSQRLGYTPQWPFRTLLYAFCLLYSSTQNVPTLMFSSVSFKIFLKHSSVEYKFG